MPPLALTAAGKGEPLRQIVDTLVLHWQGDTFEIPEGAVCLGETSPWHAQAFSIGSWACGSIPKRRLQPDSSVVSFVTPRGKDRSAQADCRTLRYHLGDAGRTMSSEWLKRLRS